MGDNNPKPPPTRPLDDKMKDLDAQDRLDNFEIQRLMSRETDAAVHALADGELVPGAIDDPDGGDDVPTATALSASMPIETALTTAYESIDDGATQDLRDIVERIDDAHSDHDGPEFGGGFVGGGPDQPVTVGVTEALGTYDPVEHGFGDGAPPRPVTMTAADLGVAGDPDGGGEIAMPADDGGEIAMPADDGGEIVADFEPTMIIDTYEPLEPSEPYEPAPVIELEPELVDLEIAVDLDQASHTFED